MTTSAHSPRAVLFDAYGTLFDVYSVSALAESLFPGHGQAISMLWRDKQIEYTRLVTTSNGGAHYQPFWDLTRAGLRYAIKKAATQADPHWICADFDAKVEALMGQYRQLSAFADSLPVLHQLKERGVVTGILSNGDPDMLDAAVQASGLAALLDHVISVDALRLYKTHPDAYGLGPKATGVPAGDTVFVSSNSWDALAATWYGFRTLWVNRNNWPYEEIGPRPTREGRQLSDVLALF